MAALDFPDSPTVGDTFTSGSVLWTWDGTTWVIASTEPATTQATILGTCTPSVATTSIGASPGSEILESRKSVSGLVVGRTYIAKQSMHIRFGVGATTSVVTNFYATDTNVGTAGHIATSFDYKTFVSNERFQAYAQGLFVATAETMEFYSTAYCAAQSMQTIAGPQLYTLWTVEAVA